MIIKIFINQNYIIDYKNLLYNNKMSEFDKIVTEKNELQEIEIKKLKEINKMQEIEIKELKNKIMSMKNAIDIRNEEEIENILEYLYTSNSIRDTAWKYSMDISNLFLMIPECDGCSDGMHDLYDYDSCRLEVLGRRLYDEEQECKMSSEELEERMRIPDQEEVSRIIKAYNNNKKLYEIADNFDLKINNLFRILKENGIIQKETDANGYKDFYIEYYGSKKTNFSVKTSFL